MREFMGWQFPDIDSHFPKMLKKNVDRGGPPEYQQPVRLRSLNYVKNKRLALDIGANVGLWSRDLVKHFDQVFAFEPVAMFRECLQLNVTDPKLVIHSTALGDYDMQATMVITEGNTGHSHIDPNKQGGDIQVIKLDNLELKNVDYIKIDCEGYEYKVIRGAEKTIRNNRPIVVLEQKPHDMYAKEYSQYAAIGLLQDWGMVKLDQVKDDWIMGWQ
jgi:FkbM family methyltransferase